MPARPLTEAWLALVGLSAATTLMTLAAPSDSGRLLVAAGVLGLAGLKARVILARYLGLQNSRFWMRAFDLTIGVFLALGLAVYMLGTKG